MYVVHMGEMAKRARPSTSKHLETSSYESAIDDLEQNGYFWIRSAIPLELCRKAAVEIQNDIGGKLDAGSTHQEEPIERLEKSTVKVMQQIRDYVMENVLKKKLNVEPIVPAKWTETLYGRVKRKHFHTRWHCDAFNTVFQRALLNASNLPEAPLQVEGEKFYNSEFLHGEWNDVPIFTFWICLRKVHSSSMSHLRIYPGSHRLPGIHLEKDLDNVVPENFRYSPTLFLGPNFPGGYEIGDLIVFHCLTQHEANPHRATDTCEEERLSMDGRFFLQL